MTVESDQPLPSRFRRLKIWSAVAVLAVLLLLGVRWWWGYVADARMTAYLDAAHARGEKVVVEDFAPLGIADEKNAAPLLRIATTRVSLTQTQDQWESNFSGDLPLSANDVSTIATIKMTQSAPLALLRQASTRPHSDWNIRFARPAFNTLLPHLNGARQLANIAQYVAMYEHTMGNDAEALDRAEDILRLSESVGASAPVIVCHLVSAGILSRDCEMLMQMAATLDVSGTARPTSTQQPASREQVEDLIAQLLDEKPLRDSARYAWEGERMMILDAVPQFAQMSAIKPIPWVIAPMFALDALRVARRHDSVSVGFAQDSYPAARQKLVKQPSTTMPSHLQKATRAFDANLGVRAGRFQLTHFRVILDRRMAATMLALRLYALDHNNALPGTLHELVPKYLPHVPMDVFSAEPRPVGYLSATPQAALCSVGEDGIDDGGSQALQPQFATRIPPVSKWETVDVLYPIRFGPTAQSSTQPAR